MINAILLLFLVSLFFTVTAIRLRTFVKITAFQGILLFVIFFVRLIEINIINLIFLLLETIIFKSIVIPYFLEYVIKRNRLEREAEPYVSNFASLFIVTAVILLLFFLSNTLKGGMFENIYFVVSISTLFTGFYLIITRHKIITHVIGFIIIENGVVILSLAVGNDMPLLVNLGILLDIFVTVLLLGMFANRIGDVFSSGEVDQLNQLRD